MGLIKGELGRGLWMQPLKRIALLLPTDTAYNRGVLRGVLQFAVPHKPWMLHIFGGNDPVTELKEWRPEGIMGRLPNAALTAGVAALGIPLVQVSGRPADSPEVPRVGPDDQAVGETAARHFLERGFSQFAYFAYDAHADGLRREAGYRKELAAAGHQSIYVYRDNGDQRNLTCEWEQSEGAVCKWVKSLPKPIAVFCVSDVRGRELAEACRVSDVEVPEDVALLACGNDDLICRMTHPALSSVELPAERMGQEAGALLERLMNGEPKPAAPILVPVRKVVLRRSSETLAIADPELAAALQYIRAHAGDWIGVRELLLNIPINRRTLERKFRAVLGRSPLEEIRRVRVEMAKELLAATDQTMAIVARQAGFSNSKQLSLIFHDKVGMTPTAYRRRFRAVEQTEVEEGKSQLAGEEAEIDESSPLADEGDRGDGDGLAAQG